MPATSTAAIFGRDSAASQAPMAEAAIRIARPILLRVFMTDPSLSAAQTAARTVQRLPFRRPIRQAGTAFLRIYWFLSGKAERRGEKDRHLTARIRAVGAVERRREAASARDPSSSEVLDEVRGERAGRDVFEDRAGRG